MSRIIRVIVKEPGKKAEPRDIADKLETFQSLVGGYIQCVTLPINVQVYCDEEALLKKDPPFNVTWFGHRFYGTIVVAKHLRNGESGSLSDKETKLVCAQLNRDFPPGN